MSGPTLSVIKSTKKPYNYSNTQNSSPTMIIPLTRMIKAKKNPPPPKKNKKLPRTIKNNKNNNNPNPNPKQ